MVADFDDSKHPGETRSKKLSQIRRDIPRATLGHGLPFKISHSDLDFVTQKFGVAREQVERDFAISHALIAIASASDHFTFYGGTALSRTFLNGLRLSEDIDLLSHEVPHKQAARELDSLLAENLEPVFGLVTADRRLSEVTQDTDASIYTIGHSRIKVQLIDGSTYARWPAQSSKIDSRYEGLPHTQLRTFTRTGFVCAKTEAWFERNTPRDLYDLWALSELGAINNEAAGVYKSHGATNSFPQKSQFPRSAPTIEQWSSALSNQCIPKVGPDEAYRVVCNSWLAATDSGAPEIRFRDR